MTSPWRPPGIVAGLSVAVGGSGQPLVTSVVNWSDASRIIGREYARESLFDQVATREEFDDFIAVADLTNPAVRHAQGNVALVPLEDRLFGPGAGLVMSAFSWPGRGSRFSDGTYGVFYAARTISTAIAETTHHQTRALTGIPATVIEKTVLLVDVRATLLEIRRPHPVPPDVYHPDDYSVAQAFGAGARFLQEHGIVYHSVRDQPDGECVAIFRPPALSPARVHQTLEYHWDGRRITVR